MNLIGNIKKRNVMIVLVIILSFILVHIVQAVAGEPGTDANPLVSQDYVDAKVSELAAKVNTINELTTKINAMTETINNLNLQVQNLQKVQSPKYEIIEVEPGKQLLLGASTEMILRGGKATAISGEKGGLSDLTSGTGADIITGQNVPMNHLLLASRDDGRGVKIVTKSWILIKGEYTIK